MDVYPTAPLGSQAQQSNVDTPTSHAENSGNSKSMLSKVKHKAKKLKNKIKKVTGSSPSPAEQGGHAEPDRRAYNDTLRHDGEEAVDGAESYEDDEEDDDTSKQNDRQLNKYEQLRSIGALEQGDGSAGEIHGGVPVSAPSTNPGTYWGSADDNAPITPYKSAGPPNALQATPTEYRNYAADDEHLVASGEEKEKSTSSTPRRSQGDVISRDLNEERSPPGATSLPEVGTSKPSSHHVLGTYPEYGTSDGVHGDAILTNLDDKRSPVGKPTWPESDSSKPSPHHVPAEFDPNHAAFDTPSASDVDIPNPANLVKPNPSSGNSDGSAGNSELPTHNNILVSDEDRSAGNFELPTRDNILVSDEDRSADRKLGLDTFDKDLAKPDPLVNTQLRTDDNIALSNEDLSTDKKLGLGTPDSPPPLDVDTHYPDNLAKPNSSFGSSKSTMANEDLSPDRKIGLGSSNTPSASDVDVPYPEDLVKPNPSFGKSESPTHDKIAVMNEDLSTDRRLGLGLASSDDHSGSSKGDLLQTSVPEFSELSGYQGIPSAPAESDNLVYRPISDPEAKLSVTSVMPGTVDRNDGKREAITQGFETGLYPDNKGEVHGGEVIDPRSVVEEEDGISRAGAYSSEAQYAKPQSSAETPVSDAARKGAPALTELLADGENVAASDGDHGRGGKWSADESGGMEDVNTGPTGTDLADESKLQQSSPTGWESKDDVKVADDVGKVQNLQKDDTGAKPGSSANVEEDAEEEFYDPNEVKDNQFEEGFALGAGEEGVLSGTLAGSAIGKLQGLRDTVTSSLGYPKQDDSGEAGGEEGSVLEGEESVLSPSKQEQRAGFVQGLRQTVASSLGYGNVSPRSAPNNDIVSERREESEVDAADLRQQEPQGGGILQGLKNVAASKLGYGAVPEKSPAFTNGSEPPQIPAAASNEPLYDGEENRGDVGHVSSEEENHGNVGHVSSDDKLHGEAGGEERSVLGGGEGALSSSEQQQRAGFAQGLRDMGHVSSDDKFHGEAGGEERSVLGGEEGALSPSKQQQRPGFVQGLRDTVANSLGYGIVSPRPAPNNNIVSERGEESDVDAAGDRQQEPQGGGTLQGLKNAVASKFGYGSASTTGSEPPQIPAAGAVSNETHYDEEENRDNVGHVSREDKLHAAEQEKGVGLLGGVKGLLSSKLGYSNQPEESPTERRKPNESASVPSDSIEQPSSYTQKLFDATDVAGGDLNAEEKQRNRANEDHGKDSHLDTNIVGQHDTASKMSPNEDVKALSEVITDKLSNTANIVGEKLGLSGSKQSPSVQVSQIEH